MYFGALLNTDSRSWTSHTWNLILMVKCVLIIQNTLHFSNLLCLFTFIYFFLNKIKKLFNILIRLDSTLGIGVVQVCLNSESSDFNCDDTRVVSDLLLVSIVPAVSIEVNFEVAPIFEVHFELRRVGDDITLVDNETFSTSPTHSWTSIDETNSSNSDTASDQDDEVNVTQEIICGRLLVEMHL